MKLYMEIVGGAAVGLPKSCPGKIDYVDPQTSVSTMIGTQSLSDADLLELGSLALVDPAFELDAISEYAEGGTFDEATGYVTPNTAEIPISKLRAETIESVNEFCEMLRSGATGQAGFYRIAGWPVKAARAEKILAGTATPEETAIVQEEVDSRGKGETVAQLATLQKDKSMLLSSAISLIDGSESAFLEQVDLISQAGDFATQLAAFKTILNADLATLLGA